MWHLVDDIKLLNGELIDLVKDVDGWDILSITFDNVNELIYRGITATKNISRHNTIFSADRVNDLWGKYRLWNHGLEINWASFLSLEKDIWWLLVQSDTKTMEFLLNEELVCYWLGSIQDN